MTNINQKPVQSDTNVAPEQGAQSAARNGVGYGIALPFAGAVTIALTLSMAGLIRAEFTPQEKVETASFEINPKVVDIIPDPTRTPPDPLREVETPPPPPQIERAQSSKPKEDRVIVEGRKIDFPKTHIDTTVTKIVVSDRDAQPLVRIPPIFPPRFLQGQNSGYCKVKFDVSTDGIPFNIKTTVCTSKQLEGATKKSVQKWKYYPKIDEGRAVARKNVETTIQFALNDERGNVLPLPSGF